MAKANPDKLLESYIHCIRTVVGTERFDSSAPDQTLRPSSTAVLNAADVPALNAADSDPGNSLRANSVMPHTILAPASDGNCGAAVPAAPSLDGFARSSEYTLQGRVGKGGMGEIFLAGQIALRRDVAIKKIIPEHLEKSAAKKIEDAFVSEALVTGYLDHPNIVPVHALGRDDAGNWFFSMKMVRGIEWRLLLHPERCTDPETQEKALARKLDIDDPARRAAHLEENLRILLSVCNAVAFAHSKHIIHRDLKPENVMVGAFGEVLAMDWGLAADVSAEPPPPGHPERRVLSRGETGIGGTPSYMAPEQFYFDENGQPSGAHLGLWTDVFLLGAMLYEVLSGHAPHIGRSTQEALLKVAACSPPPLPENAPLELAAICRKALSKNPPDRYPDALAFQKAVQEFLTHREAASIAAKAEHEAKTPEIPHLARAVVLYDQALELWPENAAMAVSVQKARAMLAVKEGHARWMRRSLYGAVASIVIGLTVGFFWIRAEQNATDEQRKVAVEALKEQRRLSFEAIFKNAEADDEKGESAKVIAALEPYLSEQELAQHPMRAKAEKLVEKARDGYKRFAAFQEKVKARDKNVSLDLGLGVLLELILIPKGSFEMGSTKYSNETKHPVEITKAFYMGKFTVTQEQYEVVAGTNPSVFKGKKKNPVESVNWFEAVAFCDKLNKLSGPAKVAFALPTEAQWEYACRAGTKTEYYFGDDEKELEKYAWFETNAGLKSGNYGTQQVDLKPANPFGLFDMHGNIHQWCHDWYDENYYKNSPKKDPTGPKDGVVDKTIKTEARALRGGSWSNLPALCRSASRDRTTPTYRYASLGFRCILPVD